MEKAASVYAENEVKECLSYYTLSELEVKDIRKDFKAGAQWMKEQMMKDAISGVIFGSRYFRQKNISLTNLSEEQYDKLKDFGEKVKVIIIKE